MPQLQRERREEDEERLEKEEKRGERETYLLLGPRRTTERKIRAFFAAFLWNRGEEAMVYVSAH